MASPGNRHCANCIGTLSFPINSQDPMRIVAASPYRVPKSIGANGCDLGHFRSSEQQAGDCVRLTMHDFLLEDVTVESSMHVVDILNIIRSESAAMHYLRMPGTLATSGLEQKYWRNVDVIFWVFIISVTRGLIIQFTHLFVSMNWINQL